MRDPRPPKSDPTLDPLLERLAFLEKTNGGLKDQLTERRFGLEVQNAALREQLEAARAELARQQEALENFCRETLAAGQARDRAEAAAQEAFQVRDDALRLREEMRGQLEADAKAREEAAALEAAVRRESQELEEKIRGELKSALLDAQNLRAQLEISLQEKSEAVERAAAELRSRAEAEAASAEAQRRKTEADGAWEARLGVAAAEREKLLAENEDVRRVAAAMEAQIQLERRSFEEARAEGDDLRRRLEAAEAERDLERLNARNDRSALSALELQLQQERLSAHEARQSLSASLEQAEAQAARQLKAQSDALAEREERLVRLEDELHALREAHGKSEAELGRLAGVAAQRDALAAERDALAAKVEHAREAIARAEEALRDLQRRSDEGAAEFRAKLDAAAAERAERAAAEPVESPDQSLLDPVWAKVIPTLRRTVAASFARLRQLPLGSIPEGPRAMIRMAAVSLTQTSDMLKALEEYFDESGAPAAPGKAETAVEAALAAWDAPMRRRQIAVQKRVDPGLPKVVLADEPLRVAVFQILRNTHDAMPRGGSLSVHIGRDAATGGVLVRFADSGPGFSAKTLETLFAPFASARPGHLGLGLTLARRILRRFGGDVEAANAAAPAKGVVVTLRLVPPQDVPPLAAEPPGYGPT